MDKSWISIGFIRRPHGVKGHVLVDALSDIPDRFRNLKQVWVEKSDGQRTSVEIEALKDTGNALLIKFRDIHTPEQAALLRGGYIQIALENAATLPEGRYYVFELIGCRVVSDQGDEIGVLRDILEMPAHDIFVVDTPRGEALIPAVRDVTLAIEPEQRRIIVRLVPGMID
jgi:16S rRNA processing protein RimM